MLKRILISIAALGVVGLVLAGPGAARASASPCVNDPVYGGENVPKISPTSNSVIEDGTGGYNCDIKWRAYVTVQYESGGSWYGECVDYHPDNVNYYAAGSRHAWLEDPCNADFTGYYYACQTNWRYHLAFVNPDVGLFWTVYSPEYHKTC